MSHRPQQSTKGNSGQHRIFSGSLLPPTTPLPPPPSYPPPKPTHICKIAVLGDASCGKSSLIRKFIHRQYATTCQSSIVNDDNDNREEGCNNDEVKYGYNGKTESAAASYNSLGGTTSLGTNTIGGYEDAGLALADYYKKDVTIWDDPNKKDGNNQDEEIKSVCIRGQCWDMNIELPLKQQTIELDDHSIISELSQRRCRKHSASSNIIPLLPLFKKMNGIIIVCRCPLRPCYTPVSSNVSLASIISNASGSDWPELDYVEEQIRSWSSFIHDIMKVNNHDKLHQKQPQKQQKRTMFVILTCADLAITNYSPREWMTLTIRMQDICNTCNINSWKMGTCINTSTLLGVTGTTTFYQNNHQQQQSSSSSSLLLQRMIQEQCRLLQDIEDGIEGAFVDLLSMHIAQTRR